MDNWYLENALFAISVEQARNLISEFRLAAEQSFESTCAVNVHFRYKGPSEDEPSFESFSPLDLTRDVWDRAAYAVAVVTPLNLENCSGSDAKGIVMFDRYYNNGKALYMIEGELTRGRVETTISGLHTNMAQEHGRFPSNLGCLPSVLSKLNPS